MHLLVKKFLDAPHVKKCKLAGGSAWPEFKKSDEGWNWQTTLLEVLRISVNYYPLDI
jgi:hypothetical protein